MVRRDLSAPQRAVQAVHAAIEAVNGGLIRGDAPHPHVVLCTVRDEHALHAALGRAEAAGVRASLFREPDRDGEATAFATEPLRDEFRGPFRKYQLLQG